MSNIRIDLKEILTHGQTLTFKSPIDCSAVTGLIVYCPEGDPRVFQFADAHGNNVGSVSLFASNVLVKVIIDMELNRAYVQNADTNAYLENKFRTKAPAGYGLGVVSNPISLPDAGALDNLFETGWYSISLDSGQVSFGNMEYSAFLLRVENGNCNPYLSVTKQTAMFATYPGADEYVRYCKNASEWTEWKQAASGCSRTLIWENADIYSNFVAQSLEVNALSEYDAIEVLYTVGIYSPGYGLSFMSSGVLPNLKGAFGGIPYDLGYVLSTEVNFDTDTDRAYRGFHWSNNTLVFRDAMEIHQYGDEEKNNGIIVPVRIYGIKGVD